MISDVARFDTIDGRTVSYCQFLAKPIKVTSRPSRNLLTIIYALLRIYITRYRDSKVLYG